MEGKRDSFFLSSKKHMKKNKKPDNLDTFKSDKFQSKDKPFNQNKRQQDFDKNRKDLKNEDEKIKKPFDKKTYRLKKYSNKYKLDQWEEQRKKKLLRNYYKEIENEPPAGKYSVKIFDEDSTDAEQVVGRFVKHPDMIAKQESDSKNAKTADEKSQKKDPFSKAKEQYNKIKQEKLDKQKEIEKSKEEKKQKMQEYKKKKQERFKKLSKKTKKGQPVMTGRLELLLEKIQKNK